MTEIADTPPLLARRESLWTELLRREDWWAIWIGLGLVVVAVGLTLTGGSIKWLAVAPSKWSQGSEVVAQLRTHAPQYLALFALWALLLGIGSSALGSRWARFLPAFAAIYAVSLLLYLLGQWDQASTTILSRHWWRWPWGS